MAILRWMTSEKSLVEVCTLLTEVVGKLKSTSILITKIDIRPYYKFDDAFMVDMQLKFTQEGLKKVVAYLDSLPAQWQPTRKNEPPTYYRVLDLTNQESYKGMAWVLFELFEEEEEEEKTLLTG